jgi:hypothetical protein
MRSGCVLVTSILALLLGMPLANAQRGQRDREDDSHRQEHSVHQQERAHQAPSEHGKGRYDAHGPEPRHEYHESVQRSEHDRHTVGQLHEVRRSEPEAHYVRQDIWQRQRAHDWQHEHRSWHERGGYHGYRIPEDRFRAHFGRGHWFRVHDVPVVVVEGSPRFQFGGFWFGVVDPCPETWSPVWYRTDDVYVDYVNDGYYMYNRQHPGIAIAVNVSL